MQYGIREAKWSWCMLKEQRRRCCACSEQQLGLVERLATGWTRRAVATV